MRTTMMRYAVGAGFGSVLALAAATGSFAALRPGEEPASRMAQFCVSEQDSEVPDAPRLYCRNGLARSEEYQSYAAECREIAERWPGSIQEQYEALARQWLILAERAGHYEEDSDLRSKWQ
jgi:hypothetical protein